MSRAEEAMRLVRQLRPGQENDFSVETAEALINFWRNLTTVLFSVVPRRRGDRRRRRRHRDHEHHAYGRHRTARGEIGIRKASGARGAATSSSSSSPKPSRSPWLAGSSASMSGWAFAAL
jgi:hypothetical protein